MSTIVLAVGVPRKGGQSSGMEVAAALGFDSPANFGKAFKRWYGLPPGAYRAGRVPRAIV